jgi:hypothetical protein
MTENKFVDNYYTSMDREYDAPKGPVFGVTAHEAAEGRFPISVAAKIKMGADAVELQLSQENVAQGLGAEAYGKEVRQDIKDLAEFNKVQITAVHVPVQIPNLSGLGREGFSETMRDEIINEVRKHVEFAGDVSKGANIVIHTGEFPRPITGRYKGFEAYPGEAKEAQINLANKETGSLFQPIRVDQKFTVVNPAIDEKGNFKRDEQQNIIPQWFDEKRTTFSDKDFKKITVDTYKKELYGRAEQMGSINKAKEEFIAKHRLDKTGMTDKKELMKLDDNELAGMAVLIDIQSQKLFDIKSQQDVAHSEYYWDIAQAERQRGNESSASNYEAMAKSYLERTAQAAQQREEIKETISNIVPVREVGLKRTADTLAQAGIIAFETTKQKKLDNPLCMTPENISPGEYGSHPDEMIEIVEKSRKRMVALLTKPKIEDMQGREISNPMYHKNISEEDAKELAAKHIKATLDTQHLGMWRRHFERRPGESEEKRDERFQTWYKEQVTKLADKGVIGHVHAVDGMGLGHTHLPAGEGRNQVMEAIETLRSRGFQGTVSSEGHGEGPERQLSAAFKLAGKATGLYHSGTQKAMSWTDVEGSYFGSQRYPPNYLFGEMAKEISPDFTLWSGIPLE